jgi:hypothetical protein
LASSAAAEIVPAGMCEKVEKGGEACFAWTKFERLVAEKIFAAR